MKKAKEPSLLRQLISIAYEQAKRRKALRILNKQEWSVEFLEYLVEHAAKTLHRRVELEVTSPQGHKFIIKSVSNNAAGLFADNDIFNHLDDEAAIQDFIRRNSKR